MRESDITASLDKYVKAGLLFRTAIDNEWKYGFTALGNEINRKIFEDQAFTEEEIQQLRQADIDIEMLRIELKGIMNNE